MSFMSIKALEYNIGIRKPTLGKILRFVVLKLCGGIIVTEMKLLKPFPQKIYTCNNHEAIYKIVTLDKLRALSLTYHS